MEIKTTQGDVTIEMTMTIQEAKFLRSDLNGMDDYDDDDCGCDRADCFDCGGGKKPATDLLRALEEVVGVVKSRAKKKSKKVE